MKEWRGAPVVEHIKEEAKAQIESLAQLGITPTLGILRVGAKGDDLAYERGIEKRFGAVGAKVQITELPENVSQTELEAALDGLNNDKAVHGILIFNPLPKHLDEKKLREQILPEKDIDCFGYRNLSYIFSGDARAYPPCTAQAVVEMLDYYGEDVTGKKVTIIGRSLVIGKPLGMLLMAKNATVTTCHTKTINLPEEAKRGDILVVSAGKGNLATKEFFHDDQVVIDVGIHAEGDHLYGDVNAKDASSVRALTPVPGGVGTVTTSVLLKHVVRAATKQNE